MFSYDISLGHWHTNLEHAFTVHQICITPSPLHSTCPCHPSLHLFITFPIASIPVLACRSVLVGLSLGETPHIHLIIPHIFQFNLWIKMSWPQSLNKYSKGTYDYRYIQTLSSQTRYVSPNPSKNANFTAAFNILHPSMI